MSAQQNPDQKTSLQDIWDGKSGLATFAGMVFRVAEEKVGDGTGFAVVRVMSAPAGTELYGLGGANVYVAIAQLRLGEFRSKLPEDSLLYKDMKRIWGFLNNELVTHGIKSAPGSVRKAAKAAQKEVSTSVGYFRSGVPGLYCLDSCDPRAVVQVRAMTPKVGYLHGVLCVELVSFDAGHMLHNRARAKTRFSHRLLEMSTTPDFQGTWAGDCYKLWEYLTDRLAADAYDAKRSHLSVVR